VTSSSTIVIGSALPNVTRFAQVNRQSRFLHELEHKSDHSRLTIESGTMNFQLKVISWSMRIRGVVLRISKARNTRNCFQRQVDEAEERHLFRAWPDPSTAEQHRHDNAVVRT